MHLSKVLSALAGSMLLFMDESSSTAHASPLMGMKKLKCKKLVYVCDDGFTKVYPNPFNGCEFDLCPEDMVTDEDGRGEEDVDGDVDDDDDDEGSSEDDEVNDPVVCKKVVHTCADGRTKVHPNPLNDCDFDPCPEDVAAEDDRDDITIEDLIDEAATTTVVPPVTTSTQHHAESDIDDDDDNRDPDKPHTTTVVHPPTSSATTAAPKAVVWTSIDASKAPAAVQDAVQLAFALYNSTSICDKLILYYDSIEAHNETTSPPKQHHLKTKDKRVHSTFHVVVNVDCYLLGVKEVGGKFILNLEQHGVNEAQPYQLTDCAHLETWSELSNWLAVRNNVGYCETPRQKKRFDLQPLRYVHYQAKTLTLLDTVVRNKNYLAIVAAVAGATAALLLLVTVVLLRRRYCGYRKLKMDGGDESPDGALGDEDASVKLTPPTKRQPPAKAATASTFL
ncbi:hypothetical protein DYB25_010958 [Aphanomyces astaci]|uniref:Uncharacterized protein n=1 Tax=Aphanomyces astaci TaxID=112090 RepID=A0A397DKP2_APHAT|nr:hypothetical protein DYB25_010958 [Aphanomyces astaci]RHY10470.1 hypothetical protein DYB36_004373 [Aphanomyces astaci]RHY66963.1 hypothetical protein DYB30_007554 [Aphanomyces astaci]RHY69400.1 hypothetical protein DYB38_008895 [Aphanomyces astaci]